MDKEISIDMNMDKDTDINLDIQRWRCRIPYINKKVSPDILGMI